MNEFEQVPETYEAENEEFDALYVMAWLMVIQALMKLLRLPQATTSTQMLQMERQVNTEVKAIFTNLERKAVNMATTKVTEAYMKVSLILVQRKHRKVNWLRLRVRI
ncbi:hypothetical protein CKQ69_30965 [Bacillus toyonensis]|nr:hypothetical protein CKQ69_30965 [Bacillus toyonensis]